MTEEKQEIYSLIIPMRGKTILIPNKALAEIAPFIDSEQAPEDHQPWHLGYLNWRGSRLPVISYERMYDENFPPLDRRLKMVAIINTQLGLKDTPYFGIAVKGIPRLGLVNKANIEHRDPDGIDSLPAVVAADVVYNKREMLIPDVKELEKLIQEYL
jgi:chemosensory pili system protein ChpC